MTFDGRQRPHEACDAAAVIRLRDKATELFSERYPQSYNLFLECLRDCYNALDPTNDYDLDIG